MLDGMAGLVLTGGEDVDPGHYGAAPHAALGDVHAARDSFELALVRAAHARKLPTLAICRGVQIVNVALGGSLVQDLPASCRRRSRTTAPRAVRECTRSE
jgi:Predicted glutamine amidotransferases